MNLRLIRCFALLFVVAVVGCGDRKNEVILAPEVDPAVQQQMNDDYDKQNAADSKNYQ